MPWVYKNSGAHLLINGHRARRNPSPRPRRRHRLASIRLTRYSARPAFVTPPKKKVNTLHRYPLLESGVLSVVLEDSIPIEPSCPKRTHVACSEVHELSRCESESLTCTHMRLQHPEIRSFEANLHPGKRIARASKKDVDLGLRDWLK
jgi:hypothetical protein